MFDGSVRYLVNLEALHIVQDLGSQNGIIIFGFFVVSDVGDEQYFVF